MTSQRSRGGNGVILPDPTAGPEEPAGICRTDGVFHSNSAFDAANGRNPKRARPKIRAPEAILLRSAPGFIRPGAQFFVKARLASQMRRHRRRFSRQICQAVPWAIGRSGRMPHSDQEPS
jgi:hypothetical protein